MHDPKLTRPGRLDAARYLMDATPGRHTQNSGPNSFQSHFVNSAGLCTFGAWGGANLLGAFNSVTGFNFTTAELLKAGERILNIRHAFNLREGINELKWPVHPRIAGKPPLASGPLAGVTADVEIQAYWALGAFDWDRATTKPSKTKLLSLGLDDVAKDLWP
jgi:aldehyde:ferredoxin oxidoreductase